MKKTPLPSKKYFEKIYPEIDLERVYNSDLKKMVKWFEVLKKNKIEIKLSTPRPQTPRKRPPEEVKVAEEAPAKKKSKTEEKIRSGKFSCITPLI